MTLAVLDASVLVAALLDNGPLGRWAEKVIGSHDLLAPHHLPVEVANVLRRAAISGAVSPQDASLAHQEMLDLDVELFPYEPLAPRIWELRSTVSAYDAWYVALAEHVRCRVATLDRRLSRAPGVRCSFLQPPKRLGPTLTEG